VFVVWEPVLPMDFSAPSSSALQRIPDRRASQYWDRGRILSHLMGEHDREGIVWDFLAVYRPGARWDASPPPPGFQGHPVVQAVPGAATYLRSLLASAVR